MSLLNTIAIALSIAAIFFMISLTLDLKMLKKISDLEARIEQLEIQ